jgi:hypothetical protein
VPFVDFVERGPFTNIGEKHSAFDHVFHGQAAPGQSRFDVQHCLLSFGLDATRNQIAILILAGLTGKEEQIAYSCRFRIGEAFAREGTVVVLGDFCCSDAG